MTLTRTLTILEDESTYPPTPSVELPVEIMPHLLLGDKACTGLGLGLGLVVRVGRARLVAEEQVRVRVLGSRNPNPNPNPNPNLLLGDKACTANPND